MLPIVQKSLKQLFFFMLLMLLLVLGYETVKVVYIKVLHIYHPM